MKGKKYKIVKTKIFKEQEKKLSKKAKTDLDEAIKKIQANPYIGEPISDDGRIIVCIEYLKHDFGVGEEEAVSMILSNPHSFDILKPL